MKLSRHKIILKQSSTKRGTKIDCELQVGKTGEERKQQMYSNTTTGPAEVGMCFFFFMFFGARISSYGSQVCYQSRTKCTKDSVAAVLCVSLRLCLWTTTTELDTRQGVFLSCFFFMSCLFPEEDPLTPPNSTSASDFITGLLWSDGNSVIRPVADPVSTFPHFIPPVRATACFTPDGPFNPQFMPQLCRVGVGVVLQSIGCPDCHFLS